MSGCNAHRLVVALVVLIAVLGVWAPGASTAPPTPLNVNLGEIVGLSYLPYGGGAFGPGYNQTSFYSIAVATNGKTAYFGLNGSVDPQMRNLVVATLTSTGAVSGVPQCYVTSTAPLNPIIGYPQNNGANTTIQAMLLNPAKSKLYLGENRSNTTVSGLSVYSLGTNGFPTGSVITYPDANASGLGCLGGLALHPTLPVLYMVGDGMDGIATYALDSNGNPTGSPTLYSLGPDDGFSVSVALNGKYIYTGVYPDILQVTSLDSTGAPSLTLTTNYTISNPQVGTMTLGNIGNGVFPRFVVGTNGFYTVRPGVVNPVGTQSFLAAWPLNTTTGQPVGSALAYPNINPPYVGCESLTIAVDTTNKRLWVANPLTATDPFTSSVFTYGITPTSYTITSSGTISTTGTNAAAVLSASNGAVCVPSANGGVPLYFNAPLGAAAQGNFVSGYQYRITVTTTNTAPTSLFAPPGATVVGTYGSAVVYQGGIFSNVTYSYDNGAILTLPLGQPSDWVPLDSVLENQSLGVPVGICGPAGLTSLQVQLDLANANGTILKSVTETASGSQVGFLLPGYKMLLTALTTNAVTTNSVTGLETFTQRSQDYLNAANVDPVASGSRPQHVITECFAVNGAEGSSTELNNMLMTMQAMGFNTSLTYCFTYGNGLTTNAIALALSTNGLVNRMNATDIVGEANGFVGSHFNFDYINGMTTNDLDYWVTNNIYFLGTDNGATAAQINIWHMTDEPGWYYPGSGTHVPTVSVNMLLDTVDFPGYLTSFQTYLQNQPGLTPAKFGASAWSSVLPVMQSVGNPNLNPGATTTNRVSYYWTMRFFADSANAGQAWGAQTVRQYTTNSVPVGVNWNNFIDRWYIPSPNQAIDNNPIVDTDTAAGGMDWMEAGRTNAYTLWTEDWFPDTAANTWSTYAAVMRSASMLGGTGTNFGGYVVGQAVGALSNGPKYKIFSLLGNGAKSYSAYTWGPSWLDSDGWSESAPLPISPYTSNSVYSEYADANRLIGQSESILYPAAPEHSKVAILLPDISGLYDTNSSSMYYQAEFRGLQLALSHGYNMPVDFVDDIDVANGILNTNSYYALYVTGPNVSAAAQTAISSWVTTYGTHNRQLVLEPGAGTANEYDTATTNFDSLAGVTAGSRTPYRINSYSVPTQDPFTALIQDTNSTDSYFYNAQTQSIAGPFQVLSPSSSFSSTFWADQCYWTTNGAANNQPATITKKSTSGGVSNFVTTFGYFPGYQYFASPNASYTNQLPQGWGVMARESAIMPVVRLVLATTNPLVPTVQLSNTKGPTGLTLGTTNNYLTTTPVEALRLNVGSATAPTNLAVVLLNWSGTPVSNLKFTVNNGIASPSSFTLASGATLSNKTDSTTTDSATMTLTDVDVVLIK